MDYLTLQVALDNKLATLKARWLNDEITITDYEDRLANITKQFIKILDKYKLD